MDLFLLLLSSALSFTGGFALAKIRINATSDDDRRDAIISQIDDIVTSFHERFSNNLQRQNQGITLFDYHVTSLVDDTSLLPIIGSNVFDREYMNTVAKIFKLSKETPRQITQVKKQQLLKEMNSKAIDLKKIINAQRGSIRLRARS